MPQTTIPLIGNFSQRMGSFQQLLDGKDQYFQDAIFVVSGDDILNSSSAYAVKRPGWQVDSTINAGAGVGMALFVSQNSSLSKLACFATTIYYGSTNVGTCVGVFVSEGVFNNITYFLITDSSGDGWFLPQDSTTAAGNTFTGDRTSGSAIVVNVSSIAGLYVGQLITATGFAVGTRILSIDSATQVTMTNAASSGAPTNTTFTREYISKIINSSFPAADVVGYMQEVNGRAYAMNSDGIIFGSALNNPASWSTDNKISANLAADRGCGLAKVQNYLVGFGAKSTEIFQDVGNSSGSVLSRMTQAFSNVGPINKFSYTKYADTIYFLSRTGGANYEIYRLAGVTPEKVSDPVISNILGAGPTNSFVSTTPLSMAQMNGSTYLFINATTFNTKLFLAYCVEQKKWTRLGWTEWWFIGSTGGALWALASATSGGKLYFANTSYNDATRALLVFTDNSAAYTMTIQTEPKVLNNGKSFTINYVELLADNQASGSTDLNTYNDDFTTATPRGSFDMTQTRKRVYRGGYYKNSVSFKLQHSANTPWRGQALLVDWTPGRT